MHLFKVQYFVQFGINLAPFGPISDRPALLGNLETWTRRCTAEYWQIVQQVIPLTNRKVRVIRVLSQDPWLVSMETSINLNDCSYLLFELFRKEIKHVILFRLLESHVHTCSRYMNNILNYETKHFLCLDVRSIIDTVFNLEFWNLIIANIWFLFSSVC